MTSTFNVGHAFGSIYNMTVGTLSQTFKAIESGIFSSVSTTSTSSSEGSSGTSESNVNAKKNGKPTAFHSLGSEMEAIGFDNGEIILNRPGFPVPDVNQERWDPKQTIILMTRNKNPILSISGGPCPADTTLIAALDNHCILYVFAPFLTDDIPWRVPPLASLDLKSHFGWKSSPLPTTLSPPSVSEEESTALQVREPIISSSDHASILFIPNTFTAFLYISWDGHFILKLSLLRYLENIDLPLSFESTQSNPAIHAKEANDQDNEPNLLALVKDADLIPSSSISDEMEQESTKKISTDSDLADPSKIHVDLELSLDYPILDYLSDNKILLGAFRLPSKTVSIRKLDLTQVNSNSQFMINSSTFSLWTEIPLEFPLYPNLKGIHPDYADPSSSWAEYVNGSQLDHTFDRLWMRPASLAEFEQKNEQIFNYEEEEEDDVPTIRHSPIKKSQTAAILQEHETASDSHSLLITSHGHFTKTRKYHHIYPADIDNQWVLLSSWVRTKLFGNSVYDFEQIMITNSNSRESTVLSLLKDQIPWLKTSSAISSLKRYELSSKDRTMITSFFLELNTRINSITSDTHYEPELYSWPVPPYSSFQNLPPPILGMESVFNPPPQHVRDFPKQSSFPNSSTYQSAMILELRKAYSLLLVSILARTTFHNSSPKINACFYRWERYASFLRSKICSFFDSTSTYSSRNAALEATLGKPRSFGEAGEASDWSTDWSPLKTDNTHNKVIPTKEPLKKFSAVQRAFSKHVSRLNFHAAAQLMFDHGQYIEHQLENYVTSWNPLQLLVTQVSSYATALSTLVLCKKNERYLVLNESDGPPLSLNGDTQDSNFNRDLQEPTSVIHFQALERLYIIASCRSKYSSSTRIISSEFKSLFNHTMQHRNWTMAALLITKSYSKTDYQFFQSVQAFWKRLFLDTLSSSNSQHKIQAQSFIQNSISKWFHPDENALQLTELFIIQWLKTSDPVSDDNNSIFILPTSITQILVTVPWRAAQLFIQYDMKDFATEYVLFHGIPNAKRDARLATARPPLYTGIYWPIVDQLDLNQKVTHMDRHFYWGHGKN